MLFNLLVTVFSERRRQVTVQQTEFPLFPRTDVNLSWSPVDILPFQDPQSYTVDISLFTLDVKSGELKRAKVLATDHPNNGTASFTIPRLPLTGGAVATPLYFQVEAAKLDSKCKRQVGPLILKGSAWSAVAYFSLSALMRYYCEKWAETQPDGQELLDQVEPCPRTVSQARVHGNFKEEAFDIVIFDHDIRIQPSKVFHPDADVCFRQQVPK